MHVRSHLWLDHFDLNGYVFFLVFTGRWLMSFWTGSSKIHELYTAACGLYVCWLSIRGVTVLLAWMPQGRTVIVHKVQEWTLMVGFSQQAQKKKKKKDEFLLLGLIIPKPNPNLHIIALPTAVCADCEDPGRSSAGCWSHSPPPGPAV